MVDLGTALQAVRNANSRWLGYRYLIMSLPAPAQPVSNLALSATGISEIVFPTIQIDLRQIPQLSTKDKFIPRRVTYTDLVLRAPTIRDTSLYDRAKRQINALSGDPSSYDGNPETIVIGEFETRTVLDLIPIAIWVCQGAQAKAFTPASANSQGAGSIPLEELRMQVDYLERASSF